MEKHSRIFVAGHKGLVGSAIVRHLAREGFNHILVQTREQTDLTSREAVDAFFSREKPEFVFLAAAKVGGILANATYPADFIRDNLALELHIIDAAYRHGTSKLQFLGSSCIYPKDAPQPIKEDYLLSGALEPTNQWYAIAKIAGIKLCQAYREQYGFDAICLMPTNLYGPGDNFDLQSSHVLPALIRKFHEARVNGSREVAVWGTGQPRREFLHVDDLASAAVYLMKSYSSSEIVNVGTGEDITIAQLAQSVADITGFSGRLEFDTTKPDGVLRKLLDVSRLHSLGWHHKIDLKTGIRSTYQWFLDNLGSVRLAAS